MASRPEPTDSRQRSASARTAVAPTPPAPAIVSRDITARGPALRGSHPGSRIRFVEAGEGPPLVLLHDHAASHETFTEAMAHLAPRFRVLAPDLPGFGASEKPDPQRYAYGYDTFAESIADLVAALGLGRVHLCGHGLGAGVALTLAATHPALVHGLVLVDANVFPADEHALGRAGRLPVLGALLWRQIMGSALFRRYLNGTVYAGARGLPRGRFESLYRAFNAPAARQAAHATLVGTADTRPLVARLPRVTAETLVVWGREDRVSPVELGRRLARELRARFDVLECGRCPPDEMPREFAALVTGFLDSVSGRDRAKPPARRLSP